MEDESTGPSAKQKNAGETDKEDGSSDDDEFMGLMLSNNMVHEMGDGFAFPLGDDIQIERGGW